MVVDGVALKKWQFMSKISTREWCALKEATLSRSIVVMRLLIVVLPWFQKLMVII